MRRGEAHDPKDTEGRYWTGRMNDGAAGDRRPAWSGIRRVPQEPVDASLRGPHHPEREMQNPTLIVLTDRNDLDDQPLRPIPALPRDPEPDACPSGEPGALNDCSIDPAAALSLRRSRSSCRRRASACPRSATGVTSS